MLYPALIAVLMIALFGALPTWKYSRAWGYGPASAIGAIVLLLVLFLLAGALSRGP